MGVIIFYIEHYPKLSKRDGSKYRSEAEYCVQSQRDGFATRLALPNNYDSTFSKPYQTKNPVKDYLTGFIFMDFVLAHFELFLDIVNVGLKFLICIY